MELRTRCMAVVVAIAAGSGAARGVSADEATVREEALKGYERVQASDGSGRSLYTLYVKADTNDVLAELPADYESQLLLLGDCIAGGFGAPSIQQGTYLVRWKRYGDRLALMRPQMEYRTSGDAESRRSTAQQYTDQLMLDVPIVAEGAGGGPIIDLDALFVDRSTIFYQFVPGDLEAALGAIGYVKAFPKNITVTFQIPYRSRGQIDDGMLVTLAFSLSLLPAEPSYTPRMADPRVGYFIAGYTDINASLDQDGRRRPIKRWDLRPAAPDLALSPPVQPIVFYIDSKTPVRYRRWVREGVLEWNRAFEAVGIVNAIEAYQQDEVTGAFMDKDPENVENNFIVWNSNNLSFAIGPCRVDPRTGQILDADVVMNDGWVRVAVNAYRKYLANAVVDGLAPADLPWLAAHPEWDTRVGLRTASVAPGATVSGGSSGPSRVQMAGAAGDGTATGGLGTAACEYGECRSMDMALARFALLDLPSDGQDSLFEGVPEDFIGQQIKDVVMHEVGHVLGLRHNFAASAVYTLDQINSAEWRDGNKPIAGSVMDYNPVNYADESRVQGPFFMPTIGPYDVWAIRYGYAPEAQLPEILGHAQEPENVFLTDEDVYGPDPEARTRDLCANTLDWVDSEMSLVQRLRGRIVERALAEGKSFQRARDAYMTLLAMQSRDLSSAARQIGGVDINRDPFSAGARPPTRPVSPETQRRALDLLARHMFTDAAFGLTPELLAHMSMDKWFDGDQIPQDVPDAQLDVHDMVHSLQSSGLTVLLSPTRLRRILDSEFQIPSDQDAFTLAEMLGTLRDSIWSELSAPGTGPFTARQPMISSLRRNLQREHLDRMISLTRPDGMTGAAAKPIAALATNLLRQLDARIVQLLDRDGAALDPYTDAHLRDARARIERTLRAVSITP